MTAYYLQTTGERITLDQILATGGEATVHSVTSRPEVLVKKYLKPMPDIEEKLQSMVSAPPPCLSLGGGYADLVWLLDIVRDADAADAFIGYVMPHVRNRLSLDLIANPATCPPQIDFSCKLRMASNLAWMTAELHANGFVIGDLHLGNSLGSDQAGCVSVIDCDSFQITAQGRLFRCEVGKADFIAPELFGKDLKTIDRTTDQDAFSLAICVFQLLQDGTHPYQGKWLGKGQKPTLNERIRQGTWPYARPAPPNWRPRPISPPFDLLHPLVQDAMTRCFQAGHRNPALRPTASEWQQILLTVENDQAYLAKAISLVQKAAWRTNFTAAKTHAATPAAAGTRTIPRRSPPKSGVTRLFGNKWFTRTAVVIVVFMLGIYFAVSVPSSKTNQSKNDSMKNDSMKNDYSQKHDVKKSTPKLWKELRDSP
jgi:DNA-binding helix-hairpin-helix protein with protein kinase domain